MDERLERLTACLEDAGCDREAIEDARRLCAAGCTEELIRHLRRCRCALMDELHRSQRRVDRLDCAIRQAEKDGGLRA